MKWASADPRDPPELRKGSLVVLISPHPLYLPDVLREFQLPVTKT